MRIRACDGDPAIVRLVEKAVAQNLVDYVEATRRVGPQIGATAVPCGEGAAAFMGIGSPLTTVKGIGSELGGEEIDAAEAFLRARGAKRATFELNPWIARETEQRLADRGYRVVDHEDVVVHRPPYSAPDPLHPVSLVDADGWPELQLQVNDAPEFAEWSVMVKACAVLPGATRFGIRDSTRAWIACGELVPARDFGVFANDATLLSARGRGAQTALILARLRTAAMLGFACLVAEVAPGRTSERNYLRCGFEIGYMRAHYARGLD